MTAETARERTQLAWRRTVLAGTVVGLLFLRLAGPGAALALVGGGLGVAGFLPPLRIPHLREVLAVVLMLLGAAVAVRAIDHWARAERAMRLGRPLPASRFPGVLAVAVALGALLLLVATVLPVLR